MSFPRGWIPGLTVAGMLAVPGLAHAQRTVFLNLEAQAVNTNSGNDPSLNSYASTSFVPGTLDGYPALDDEQRAELMYWFKHGTTPFDIHFTYERPAVGNYDMLVFGSEADNTELFPDLGCSASIGLADCAAADAENISFMFWGCMPAMQQMDLRRVAFFGLTALGFGWGLEGVDVSGQVMGSYTLSGIEFGNSCVSIAGASQCTHLGCVSGQKNSTADLTPAVGARIDDGPPTLTIDSPANLAVVGSDVTVTATVDDAFGDVTVSLEIVEAGQSLDDDLPPHSWGLTNIPDGMWTLRVTATDVDANVTMQEVVVCVGVDECGGAVDTGGSSSSSGGADGTSTTAAADATDGGGGETSSSSGGDPTTGGGAVSGIGSSTVTAGASGGFGGAPDTGCSCRAGSRPGGVGVLLVGLGGLFGLRRRRR